jgi:hypothetical protein
MAQSLTMQGRPTSENSRAITKIFEVLMRFGASWPSGRAPASSGRAPLEWSRPTKLTQGNVAGVVAHLPGGRAPWWSGRAPSKSLKTAKTYQIRPLASLLVFSCLQMHNESLLRGNWPLYAHI